MEQYFDIFNYPEPPVVILCNPNGDELYSLGSAYDRVLNLKYNALSYFEFKIPYKINGVLTESYPFIVAKRLIWIRGYGYFKIDKYNEDNDGIVKTKNVTCCSIDSELIKARIVQFGGTWKFYNGDNPSDPTTLMGNMMARIPKWTLGDVDGELWGKYRTFDVSDSNVYNFFMNDVETSFGCIVEFDYQNYVINFKVNTNATYESDIYLSYDNLIKDSSFTEIADEITTKLNVYGGGNLDIRSVNPLGTPAIYDFSYFMEKDISGNLLWMSHSLYDSIVSWQVKIVLNSPTYSDTLVNLKLENERNLLLYSNVDPDTVDPVNPNILIGIGLSQLESDYLTKENLQKLKLENNLQGTTEYTAILAEMATIQSSINDKQSQIDASDLIISGYNSILSGIHTDLSFSTNFTGNQLKELDGFIYENTFQNENIVKLDSYDAVRIQEITEELLLQGRNVLSKISQPRYEYSLNTANFVFLNEFAIFTNQMRLGSVVTIEKENRQYIQSVLLEIKLNFDEPSDFSLTFSNRLRLDNGEYRYTDLFGQTVRTSSSVKFDSVQWGNWSNNYKDEVTTFINSSLNTANNALINSSKQEILINENGLRGKKVYDPLYDTSNYNGYSGNQVWLTSNVLAFSKDNFGTAGLALGQIDFNGSTRFGLIAEQLVGNLVAGNALTITNLNKEGEVVNFTLDENGASLNNAKFVIKDASAKSEIHMNDFDNSTYQYPFYFLGAKTSTNPVLERKFSFDSSGNVFMKGSITADSGSIGGWIINSQGIQDKASSPVNYIRSDGTAKLGILTITKDSGTFDGNVYAKNLKDSSDNTIFNQQGGSAMGGGRVYGGTIGGLSGIGLSNGFKMFVSGNTSILDATSGSALITGSGSSSITVGSNNVSLGAPNGAISISGVLSINTNSSISTPGGFGSTVSFTVSTPSGSKVLNFSKGIFIG